MGELTTIRALTKTCPAQDQGSTPTDTHCDFSLHLMYSYAWRRRYILGDRLGYFQSPWIVDLLRDRMFLIKQETWKGLLTFLPNFIRVQIDLSSLLARVRWR